MNLGTLYGLPAENIKLDDIHQLHEDTCAIKAQEIVLNSLGIPATEDDLRQEAFQNGWYKPGEGTPAGDVGKLLESHGVAAHPIQNASIRDLANELLTTNCPVIVGVDSGELCHPGIDETFEDIMQGQMADHALLVGGIETNDDFATGTVNLIDPGTGDFCKEYDFDTFSDAWDDSGNFMISLS